MIYQIYGFNMLCDYQIEALQEYISDTYDDELPKVSVSVVDDVSDDVVNAVEISGDYANAVFSNHVCCFNLVDEVKIRITSDSISMTGDSVHSKRIGEELSGPCMIVLSRFHKRAVLHGSAFLYNGKAYLVLAHPGAGKSTLSTAMVKYQEDLSFLADDIICVEENGSTMFCGIQVVNLNDDSLHGLNLPPNTSSRIEPCMSIYTEKTTCEMSSNYIKKRHKRIPIGGIILLEYPLAAGLIQIRELDIMQSFCKIMKNIKMRNTLTNDLLIQEMNIINKMIRQNIFIIELRIEHDYTKLQQITNRLREFIDGYNCS